MQNVSTNLEKLTRFDTIRFSKLFEIVQFTVIVFVLAFFIGSYTDKLFPIKEGEVSDFDLWRDTLLQLAVISISAYYVIKAAKVIPFLFSVDSRYVSGSHGENVFGAGLAIAIIFVYVQKNFGARLSALKVRYT